MTKMTALECLMTWLTQNYERVYRTAFQNPFLMYIMRRFNGILKISFVPFQMGNVIRGISSNGRAPASHAGGTGIDTRILQG